MQVIENTKEKMEEHRRAAEDHQKAADEHRRAFQLSCQTINESMEKAAEKERQFMKSVTSKLYIFFYYNNLEKILNIIFLL